MSALVESTTLPWIEDWTTPRAIAIPKRGLFRIPARETWSPLSKGSRVLRFSVVATVKFGREQAIRDYGKDCHALPDEKEAFGFKDGISHPAIEGSGIPGTNPDERP